MSISDGGMRAMPDGTGAAKRRGLARRRKAVGLTQEQLAEQLGVERTTVVRWERGQTQPVPWLRPKLAKVLGIPADRLEELLAGDDAPASPAIPALAAARQLPPAVSGFTGRVAELAALDDLLLGPQNAMAAVISAVSGTAGVGKTALAVHWAHRAAGRFPHGQLYVNLRGYDPDQPMLATDGLAGFLHALGVPGQDIPPDEAGRSARYRSLLAGQRTLILLDNAATVEQVRPLLPGHPECRVVVTSRDALAGLVTRDGARRLDLDLLPLADAVALLRELIGARVDEETEAAVTLALQCSRLPLALRVAAEMAVTRPDVPLTELVAELSDQQHRLDLLSVGGDPRTMVRGVLSWSYDHLDDDTARAFRLAGLHPGRDFDPYAAAALTGSNLDTIRDQLGALTRTHLIEATAAGRYGMHDLLRAYAREQAAEAETDDSCQQALTRLFDYYLSAAAAAMDSWYPAEAHRRPRIPHSAAAVPPMRGEAAARAWLDGERANLVAVTAHCADHGWPAHATTLAGTLYRYLMTGSHLPEAHTIFRHALQAARRSGDIAAQAEALNGIGGIGFMNGHFRDAADNYRAALERYRQCDDFTGQARLLYNLGITAQELRDFESAADYHRQAITAFEDVGDSLGVARALADLAATETQLGSYDQAAEHLQLALPVLRDARDQFGEADTLTSIGDLSLRRGQLMQAARFYRQALAIYRRIDHPTGVASELSNLGHLSTRQGDYPRAVNYLRRALALHRQTGDQHGEAVALFSLAEALRGAGQPAAARAELETALQLAAETGNTYQQASAHRDLADGYHAAGQDDEARHHWHEAVTLYTQLGAPESEQVRARLAALDDGQAVDA
jgi:tetratricopeptide (TPR) repeat protein/transcriptional regulator with XRE-family HTH domain